MLLCLLLNLIIQFLSLGKHRAELCFLSSGVGYKQEENLFLKADLSCCPGVLGDDPFRSSVGKVDSESLCIQPGEG